jgi:HAD superfamily hydrolase (TIGR01509 family)
MLRGVIFDFDGVLVDSERGHFEAFRMVLKEHEGFEIDFDEYTEHFLAHSDHVGTRKALERYGRPVPDGRVDELATKKKAVFAALLPGIAFLPGARELIVALHDAGIPLAIASGARRVEIVALLEGAGLLGRFRGIVSADDVGNFKPHPEPYLRGRAIVGAGDDPRGVVVFEDSPTGMASARAANLRVVGVTNSHPRERLGLAHRVVDSLTEIEMDELHRFAIGA